MGGLLLDLFKVAGSLGLFIYGMMIMSDGIQKVAGEKMKAILRAMTNNRVSGVFTGFLTTALIQSSSATTVMIVSFVNAGLLSLRQSVGVIMGANIGTTVTALLITFFGFSKFSISTYTLPILAIGFPLLFMKNEKFKHWGEFLIGFAILFMGLDALKNTVPNELGDNVQQFLHQLTGLGYLSILLFVLIGTLLTITVQSSSAAIAITLTLCYKGFIPFEIAAAIVLGENIGTTITANIAAIVGNVFAKRAARAHFIFNIFGVLWMLVLFPFYLRGIEWFMVNYTGLGSPFENVNAINWALVIFHISFNVFNTLIWIGFLDFIISIAEKLVPSKSEDDETFHLEYIGSEITRTPELSLEEARKEVITFGRLINKMHKLVGSLLFDNNSQSNRRILTRIKDYEGLSDHLEEEIADYLVKVAEGRLSPSASIKMRSILSIINDMERIADFYLQMSQLINDRLHNKRVTFSEDQNLKLKVMYQHIDEALDIMSENLNNQYNQVTITKALAKEQAINNLKWKFKKSHLKSIERKEYHWKSGIVYIEIFNFLEKIGNNILDITEAITGHVGKDEEDLLVTSKREGK